MIDQKKTGILISYFNTALNMLISIFFTPFLISSLGQAEYGLYRIVQSFSAQLSVMSFGMSALVTRNIVYYNTKKQKKEKENFLALSFFITILLFLFVLILGISLTHFSHLFFGNSFTHNEMLLAKKLLFILVLNVGLTILNDYFSGFANGYEKFVFSNGIRTCKLVFRILLLIILLNLGFKSLSICLTDLVLTILMLLTNIYYSFECLRERIRYYFFDKIQFKESMLFSFSIFFQAIINQVNSNLDSIILGIMTDTKTVAVYSVALLIYGVYSGLTITVSGVFFPKITSMIADGASGEELTDVVIYTGRYQFIFAAGIFCGFYLFGDLFMNLWLGEEYISAYKITLILMLPMIIPLVQSVVNSILDAMLKRIFRSLILLFMALINIVLSIIFIKKIGYIGAALGTAFSVIVGHIFIMNYYYYKFIQLNIFRMFKAIFHGIFPCALLATLINIPLDMFILGSSWGIFIFKAIIFCLIYFALLWLFGLNISEKSMITNLLKKFKKNKEY